MVTQLHTLIAAVVEAYHRKAPRLLARICPIRSGDARRCASAIRPLRIQHGDAPGIAIWKRVSATIQAIRAAISTHQREKLGALRNAVLNVALSKTADEEKQIFFL